MINFNSVKEVGEELEIICSKHGLNICYDVEGYFNTMKPMEKLIFLKTRYIDLKKMEDLKLKQNERKISNGVYGKADEADKPFLRKGGKNKK